MWYFYADGRVEIKSGGSRAWRDNNPGNTNAGRLADNHGPIGSEGGFAIFPDEQSGSAAMESNLRNNYINDTMDEAVRDYSPATDERGKNNVARNQAQVRDWTGMSGDTKLSDMTPVQFQSFLNAMARKEGYTEGGRTIICPSVEACSTGL